MGTFPPPNVSEYIDSYSDEKGQAFDEKFGDEFRTGVLDYDLAREELNKMNPPEESQLAKEGNRELADALDELVLDGYGQGVNGMLTQDSTIEKIENLMEKTGQTSEEIGEQLKGTNGQVLEKLEELTEQAQSKGFVDRLAGEDKNNRRR